VYCTNSLILLSKNMLCSELYYQKGFNLVIFSYEISGPLAARRRGGESQGVRVPPRHTHTHTLSLSLSRSLSLPPPSLSFTHTHPLYISASPSLALYLPLSFSLSFSLSHTLSPSCLSLSGSTQGGGGGRGADGDGAPRDGWEGKGGKARPPGEGEQAFFFFITLE